MRLSDHPGWVAAGIVLLALVLRLLHVWQMSASPLFADPAVDAATYVEYATHLAAGQWLGWGQGPFWQPPLYPYVLALVKLVFADSFFYAVRFLQAVMGALSCLLVYRIGRRLFAPGIGAIAAFAAAAYGPLIYFDARLLPTGLATFLGLLGLLLLLYAVEHPLKRLFLAAGMVWGTAALAVATMLALVPLAAGWLAYRYWHLADRGRVWIGIFLVGVALPIVPVTLYNDIVGEDAVLISYNGGVNFFIGNNADSEQTLAIRPGWEWEELVAEPLRQGITRPSAKSSYFYDRAFAFIRDKPVDYIGLLAHKTIQFCSGDEIGRNQEIYYWRKYSSVLALSLWKWGLAFPFGLVGPLALIGLLVHIRRQGLTLPFVFVLGYSFAVLVFFVASRYRVPVVPLLLLFATYGGHCLYGYWRQKIFWPLAVFAALLLAANFNLPPMDMRGTAATQNDLGNVYLRNGRYQMALLKFKQAVQQDPHYWQAWFNAGSLQAMRGDLRGAQLIFRRVLEHNSERADVWSNLAGTYVGLGELPQAVRTLERALVAAPPRPDLYVELIRLYIQQRQYAEADAAYHRALSDFPFEPRLHALHDEINH
jgi:4-amino-4-deoxy-L-arabinose transferase-like glycosyltransferase